MMKEFIVFITFSALVFSCTKDKTKEITALPDYCADTVSFVNDIKVIFDVNCSTSGCHDAASNTAGYTLETYAEISASAEECLGAMRADAGYVPMPFNTMQLADSTIQELECWILQGKANN